jgi:hypothetical protein
MSYGAEAPFYYDDTPAVERDKRFYLTDDTCTMDNEHFFVRGCIEIPVIDNLEPFIWNVWVSLSETSFNRVLELWETEGRENEEPYFGWLSTSIPDYPETLNLKINVHTRHVGIRPFIELESTDHPLAVEQREGITLERVREIHEFMLKFNKQNEI